MTKYEIIAKTERFKEFGKTNKRYIRFYLERDFLGIKNEKIRRIFNGIGFLNPLPKDLPSNFKTGDEVKIIIEKIVKRHCKDCKKEIHGPYKDICVTCYHKQLRNRYNKPKKKMIK